MGRKDPGRSTWDLEFELAKNDFHSRYASSQLGILWAFIRPVAQAFVYIFIFKVLRARPTNTDYPYALWLLPGMIAWFFFSESITAGGNSLLEYSYLVKKVRFHIDILPRIKVLSSFFVHLFFILLIVVLFLVFGMPLSWKMLQLPYYTLGLLILSVSMARINCSIVPFFRDFSQILEIILMAFIWACPIMWDISIIPERFQTLVQLNPMYYIVTGYRNSYINGAWFFEQGWQTPYFWGFVLLLDLGSRKLFQRLKPHFADIL